MNDQKNRGEKSPGELLRGGTRNRTRVDIFTTRHLGYGGAFRGLDKRVQEIFLLSIFFGKIKSLSLIVGTLITTLVKKYGLVLLDPVTSAKYKDLSSQQAIVELIWDFMGGGEFYNSNHILALREEISDRQ